MESQQPTVNPSKPAQPSAEFPSGRVGRGMGGLIIVAIGVLFLAKQAGADLPWWLFTWPMGLIALGFYIGARHGFRDLGWLIPVGVGGIFLADKVILDIALVKFFWPVFIIIIGLVMVFRPKKHRVRKHRRERGEYWRQRWEKNCDTSTTQNAYAYTQEPSEGQPVSPTQSPEDCLDAVAVFGAIKKVIVSKNFQGGEAVTFFGGIELNLMRADINGNIELDFTCVFGGAKIFVPPHWKVQTDELVVVFGGIEDKRPLPAEPNQDPNKVLVLKGTCVFGGIDIKSY